MPQFLWIKENMMMKTLLILGLLAASLFLQITYAETGLPVAMQKQANSQLVKLAVQNMTCAMCKFTIKKALQDVNGVKKADVDYEAKTATVAFDPQIANSAALIKATTDAGYPATVHPPKQ
jgi:periplasmic mercuric ion binding protein